MTNAALIDRNVDWGGFFFAGRKVRPADLPYRPVLVRRTTSSGKQPVRNLGGGADLPELRVRGDSVEPTELERICRSPQPRRGRADVQDADSARRSTSGKIAAPADSGDTDAGPGAETVNSGFVDTYLRLNREEARVFDAALAALPPEKKEAAMPLTISWKEEGRVEGRVEEARRVLLRVGAKRLGTPSTMTSDQINAISSIQRLERMIDRMVEVDKWDDLLGS